MVVSIFLLSATASAATSVPEKLIYEARLLDSGTNDPLTTAHEFRFSFWLASPVNAGDVVGGVIDPFALNYGGWEEEQTVTPNDLGFVSFELGTVSPLPEIDYTEHLYLQVEVKAAGDPITAYEILDRDPADPLNDRAPVGSVPYALNADMIDNAEIGTSDGDIVLLGPGGVFPSSVMPGGTDQDTFILDENDSSVTSIGLQFGSALGKLLTYDIGSGYFNFNDSVNIEGNLTLTGTVDGYDVSDLGDDVTAHLDGGASKHDASEIDVEAVDGHFYSTGDLETVIDDLDEAIFGATTALMDRIIVLNSQFEGASYVGDGSDNIGRLYLDNDNTAKENYYEWTSTQSDLQDYDIILQITVPKTFDSWDAISPWTVNYRSSTADPLSTKADIFMWDTAGNPVTLTGMSTNLVSTSWSQTGLGFSGSPAFTQGESFIIAIRLYAKDNETMNIGEIQLNYTG